MSHKLETTYKYFNQSSTELDYTSETTFPSDKPLIRDARAALTHLSTTLSLGDASKIKEALWEALLVFQYYPFKTARGLDFTYEIKGNEIFFSRKSKSVTRSSVDLALEKTLKLVAEGVEITGPKMIGGFGASYLYPIFIRFNIL